MGAGAGLIGPFVTAILLLASGMAAVQLSDEKLSVIPVSDGEAGP